MVQAVLDRPPTRVLAVSNGSDALAICERYSNDIHLLLTDVIMPGMAGPQLAARMREFRPDTKVLFMSGYTEDRVQPHYVSERRVAVLQKPFSASDLAEKVREVLDT
jgi:CheY-like chemotaxis protein